jgi:serine kinase of HPr protein (carbohydrate metabolism regulator)
MGRTKDEFMNVRIRAEMDERVYLQIPEHLRDEMVYKGASAVNLRELYKADKHWVASNIDVGDCMKKRSEHEARIRIENK